MKISRCTQNSRGLKSLKKDSWLGWGAKEGNNNQTQFASKEVLNLSKFGFLKRYKLQFLCFATNVFEMDIMAGFGENGLEKGEKIGDRGKNWKKTRSREANGKGTAVCSNLKSAI